MINFPAAILSSQYLAVRSAIFNLFHIGRIVAANALYIRLQCGPWNIEFFGCFIDGGPISH